ncbi:granzyme E [Salminus brasiliensis]|uniref:granzyme E n=1 Tax=Salminus brasiliensis TaxID=930266 RepID=UPI003B832834
MSVLLCLGAFVLLQNVMPGGSMQHGIIGGRVSDPGSHPYMVYIYNWKTNERCDGFLVSKDYVITAAHCKTSVVVFLGIYSTEGLHITNSTSVTAIPHPAYNNNTYENDIMLLKLCKPAPRNKRVKPVALPASENEEFSTNCLVMGWGSQEHNKRNLSSVLKEVNVTISKTSACTTPDMICSEGFKGPGKGDSGGPLICGNVAHGIVSSNFILNKTFVSRYVRTAYHLSWINSIIKKPPKDQRAQPRRFP